MRPKPRILSLQLSVTSLGLRETQLSLTQPGGRNHLRRVLDFRTGILVRCNIASAGEDQVVGLCMRLESGTQLGMTLQVSWFQSRQDQDLMKKERFPVVWKRLAINVGLGDDSVESTNEIAFLGTRITPRLVKLSAQLAKSIV